MPDAGRSVHCPKCDAANAPAPGEDARAARCGACGEPLFPGRILDLTAVRFNAHASVGALPMAIDFWAPWCGPCQTMAPVFERLAAEVEPLVRFAKVNTDEQPALARHFRIQSIPTMCVIRDQREIGRTAGLRTTAELRRWLYTALSTPEHGRSEA